MATCRELANNQEEVIRLSKLYLALEKSATPTYLMFPWFPGRDRKARDSSTKALYDILLHYVDTRRKATVPTADAIDVLIKEGDDNVKIASVRFIYEIRCPTLPLINSTVRYVCNICRRYQHRMFFSTSALCLQCS
jgi:hypothetical protein